MAAGPVGQLRTLDVQPRGFLARFGLRCGDLFVVGLVFFLLGAPATMLLDPHLWAEERWLAQIRSANRAWQPNWKASGDPFMHLFVDAQGGALPTSDSEVWRFAPPVGVAWRVLLPEGLCRFAYASTEVDPWGRPWIAVIRPEGDHWDFLEVLSAGPNGDLEWGSGDDLRMPTYFRWFWPRRQFVEQAWYSVVPLLWLVVVPYCAVRCALTTRSRRLWLEGLRAAGIAFAPASIGWLIVVRSKLADDIPLDTRLLVVSPVVAVCATLSAVLWGLAFAWRLQRPPPSEGS